jgi:ABC-2 type transport system ATP-binding protein
MSAGKIVAQGSIEDLRNEEPTRLVMRTSDTDKALELLGAKGLTNFRIAGDQLSCEVANGFDVAGLNAALVKAKVPVLEIRLERSSLEEKFVKLTGEGFEVVR